MISIFYSSLCRRQGYYRCPVCLRSMFTMPWEDYDAMLASNPMPARFDVSGVNRLSQFLFLLLWDSSSFFHRAFLSKSNVLTVIATVMRPTISSAWSAGRAEATTRQELMAHSLNWSMEKVNLYFLINLLYTRWSYDWAHIFTPCESNLKLNTFFILLNN